MKTSDFMETPLSGEIQWSVTKGAHQSLPCLRGGGGATSGVIELVSFQRDLHRREI